MGQYNRYMGHVSNNIGGVYENHKTYDQEGPVYTYVPGEHQEKCMAFLQEQLFETPEWLLDKEVFGRIEYSGAVERIRRLQVRTLNNILSLGRMARLIEAEALESENSYSLTEMMQDLRTRLGSELAKGQEIDTYRRNLQKAHIDRLHYLLTAENQAKQNDRGGYRKSTAVNTSQSDIRSIARAELSRIQRQARSASGRTSDAMTRYHLEDVVARIELILNPS